MESVVWEYKLDNVWLIEYVISGCVTVYFYRNQQTVIFPHL